MECVGSFDSVQASTGAVQVMLAPVPLPASRPAWSMAAPPANPRRCHRPVGGGTIGHNRVRRPRRGRTGFLAHAKRRSKRHGKKLKKAYNRRCEAAAAVEAAAQQALLQMQGWYEQRAAAAAEAERRERAAAAKAEQRERWRRRRPPVLPPAAGGLAPERRPATPKPQPATAAALASSRPLKRRPGSWNQAGFDELDALLPK